MSGTSGSRVLSEEFILSAETLMSSWDDDGGREERALRGRLAPCVADMKRRLSGLKQAGLELASMVDFPAAHEFKLSSRGGLGGHRGLEVAFVCRTATPVTEPLADKIKEAFEAMRVSGGLEGQADMVPVKCRFQQREPFDLFANTIVDGAEREIEARLRTRFDSAVQAVVKALAAERSLELVREDAPSQQDLWRPGVTRGWLRVQVLARLPDYEAGLKQVEAVVDRALRGM